MKEWFEVFPGRFSLPTAWNLAADHAPIVGPFAASDLHPHNLSATQQIASVRVLSSVVNQTEIKQQQRLRPRWISDAFPSFGATGDEQSHDQPRQRTKRTD